MRSPRRGFTSVEYPAAGTGDRLDELPRQGRDPAGALEQVENRPLGPKDHREFTADIADDRLALDRAALGESPPDPAVTRGRDRIGIGLARQYTS